MPNNPPRNTRSPLPGGAPKARKNKGLTKPKITISPVTDIKELTSNLTQIRARGLPDLMLTNAGVERSDQPITGPNVAHIFAVCGIEVRLNMMTKEVEYRIGDHWVIRELGEQIATDCLRRSRLRADTSSRQTIVNLALGNRYHPAEDWVLQKPWDGRDHFTKFVEAMPFSDMEAAQYYLWRFFVQVIECVRGWRKTPPMPKDLVLVLVGGQGLYKTTWVHNLMPTEFTQVSKSLDLGSFGRTDNTHQLTTRAITEIGELDDTFGRTAQGAMKNFFSAPYDEYRRPYMPTAVSWPRNTCFVATVNFLQWQRDITGGRRFAAVTVEKHLPNPNEVVDMQQLFAQVNYAWEEYGETHIFLPHEAEKRLSQEATYTESTIIDDKMSAYFDHLLETKKHDPRVWLPLTFSELVDVVGVQPDRRISSEISEWLAKRGILRKASVSDPRTRSYPAQKRNCWVVPLTTNDFDTYSSKDLPKSSEEIEIVETSRVRKIRGDRG